MAGGRVLVVDDVAELRGLVRSYLEAEGYEVIEAADGRSALESVVRLSPDVLVLDIRLPDLDGLSVCREIRKSRNLPILILSARGEDVDKILGLEMGADDYLAKPFNPRELVARVKAMFRRWNMTSLPEDQEVIHRRGLRINVTGRRVDVEGQEVALTAREFSLLRVLAERPGRVFGRQELLDRVWGLEFQGDERTVDGHVRNLRAKLLAVTPVQFITSVRGVGYRFEL